MVGTTKEKTFYKCKYCGNIVYVVQHGAEQLFCCGQLMDKLEEQIKGMPEDAEHIPVVLELSEGLQISLNHPTDEWHHINLIQIIKKNNLALSHQLFAGDKTEKIFENVNLNDVEKIVILCNKHNLWVF